MCDQDTLVWKFLSGPLTTLPFDCNTITTNQKLEQEQSANQYCVSILAPVIKPYQSRSWHRDDLPQPVLLLPPPQSVSETARPTGRGEERREERGGEMQREEKITGEERREEERCRERRR